MWGASRGQKIVVIGRMRGGEDGICPRASSIWSMFPILEDVANEVETLVFLVLIHICRLC